MTNKENYIYAVWPYLTIIVAVFVIASFSLMLKGGDLSGNIAGEAFRYAFKQKDVSYTKPKVVFETPPLKCTDSDENDDPRFMGWSFVSRGRSYLLSDHDYCAMSIREEEAGNYVNDPSWVNTRRGNPPEGMSFVIPRDPDADHYTQRAESSYVRQFSCDGVTIISDFTPCPRGDICMNGVCCHPGRGDCPNQ